MKKISGQMTKAVPHPAKLAAPMTMMSSSLLEVSLLHRKAIVEALFEGRKEGDIRDKQLLRELGNEQGLMYCNAQTTHLLRTGRAQNVRVPCVSIITLDIYMKRFIMSPDKWQPDVYA